MPDIIQPWEMQIQTHYYKIIIKERVMENG